MEDRDGKQLAETSFGVDSSVVNNNTNSNAKYYGLWVGSSGADLSEPLVAFWQQFTALFTKRLIHSRRNLKLSLAQVLLPMLFLGFNIFTIKFNARVQKDDMPPLTIRLDDYKRTSRLPFLVNAEYAHDPLLAPFVNAYTIVKQAEYEVFLQVISSWEREHLLLNV